jgi:glutathione S-transferase
MGIDVYWGSGSPYSWRVLLALEHKRLPYVSHELRFSTQAQKSPHMLAVLYYLDLKYPEHTIFGRSPEEAGVIMRVICEFQAYIEEHLMKIVRAVESGALEGRRDELTRSMHAVGREARTIEGRLSQSDWIVGESCSAADMVIYPSIQILQRALGRPEARELSSRFLPVEVNYPALCRWMRRVEALPGYERTYPPSWREATPGP